VARGGEPSEVWHPHVMPGGDEIVKGARARGRDEASEQALAAAFRADPNAAGFYERNGAARIGEVPSDAVPGRLLLLYELGLIPRGPS
jgi:hypothetical protein